MNVFCRGIAGIEDKLISICLFVPDDILAATTPVVFKAGNSPWAMGGSGFSNAFLFRDGLQGGTGRYLNPGLIPTVHFKSNSNAGGSVYHVTSGSQGGEEFGAFDGTNSFLLATHFSDGRLYGNVNAPLQSTATSAFAGFYSLNRTGASSGAVYRANQANPIASVLTITNTSVNLGVGLFGFCYSTNGIPTNYTTRRISFMGFHDGLSMAESNILFAAVNCCRKRLGGGFI